MKPFFLALGATALLWLFVKRYTAFVAKNFNTQSYTDPRSVPGQTPSEATGDSQFQMDSDTLNTTAFVKIPQAQLASGYGVEVSPNPINPVLPAMQYGNKNLDSPTTQYVASSTPATGYNN